MLGAIDARACSQIIAAAYAALFLVGVDLADLAANTADPDGAAPDHRPGRDGGRKRRTGDGAQLAESAPRPTRSASRTPSTSPRTPREAHVMSIARCRSRC